MKKLYRKEEYQSRIDWLNHRGAFGGSSASALLDSNPYMSKLDLYCSAINPNVNEHEDDNENEITKYGQDAESIIRDLVKLNFAKKYRTQSPNGFTMYRRKDKPYMTATLDGIMTDIDTQENYILEIKTHIVRNSNDLTNWDGHLPQNYFIQGIHYLMVLNDFKGIMFACKLLFLDYDTGLVDREEIRYYTLKRDDYEKDVAYLEKIETEFYENHILKHIPPNIEISL